ncbi:magnesium transporter [Candidatus Sulfidibacterium hydrothermale]|uniref:magnesium transporter n=1 Tax=Candidatus Sulfidibacterium hydrothermale TaxID=2875962 RepID=UPI001F0A144E|nr:magnesium transporter [Candidatus Sulfidibacterium hydrothermale]UBM61185.1 magnesium transporter [Candidatus Sulfidibacterium hydrothermale]
MTNTEIFPDIEQLLDNKNWDQLKKTWAEMKPEDIAEIIKNLHQRDVVVAFRLIPKEKAAEVFSELDPSQQEYILSHIVDNHIRELLEELPPDDRTSVFEEVPEQLKQKLLNLLPADERKEALGLLGYPENSVGRIMTPDYVVVKPDWTIEKAIQHIKKIGADAETINMIYVEDDDLRLIDDIPIRRFILADPQQKVADIMDHEFIAINALEDQEEAYRMIKKYDINVLPVVGENGVLIGIVTVDDILDVIEEETTEDFQKSSAIVPVEEKYYTASTTTLYKKRIGWLFILLLTDFFSSTIIAHFQHSLETVIALAFFIPILIDSGGNIAAQSSTLIIRALATGSLSVKKWFLVMKKELIIGLLIGLTLGLTLYIRGFFWRGGPTVGMVVALSMVAISLWSNLLGSLLPIVLTKFKLDPAVISSPLLTTVVDSTGLLIYFSLADYIFHL